MSTRTPRNTGNTGNARNTARGGNTANTANTGNTRTARNPGNTANPGNASNARSTGSTANPGNAGSVRTAGNIANTSNNGTPRTTKARLPIFNAEMQVYVRLKPSVEAAIIEAKRTNPTSMPQHWQAWDLGAQNDDDVQRKAVQQRHVTEAVKATIDGALGPDNGWACVVNKTLRDDWLRLGPEPLGRKWWGVEIVTAPMSVSKEWQMEIKMAWDGLGRRFDFWVDQFCGFHVHIAPGPTLQDRYTVDQIARTAKAAFYWEYALQNLLEDSRRWNDYCLPNDTIFASHDAMCVPQAGWDAVFSKIDDAAEDGETNLVNKLKGGDDPRSWTRNVSTNFCPLHEIGTIELRRQGGVASGLSTIRCILLAVTLHISALRYDFDKVRSLKDNPSEEALIKELAGCIKSLPETCHGTRFVHWLKWCQQSYAGRRTFTTEQINTREEAFRKGDPAPEQPTYHPQREVCVPEAKMLPAYVLAIAGNTGPAAGQGITLGTPGSGGGARAGGAATGRGGAAQGSSTPSHTPATQGGRGGGAATSGRGGAAPSGRGGAATSGKGGAATSGRGGGAASGRGGGASTGTTRPPAGSGTTTRLPERPAPSSRNTTNTTAPLAAQRRRPQGQGT